MVELLWVWYVAQPTPSAAQYCGVREVTALDIAVIHAQS
jgi:hypothetical protein